MISKVLFHSPVQTFKSSEKQNLNQSSQNNSLGANESDRVNLQNKDDVVILDRNHPDVLNAVSVLTVGSNRPATAFRQKEDFKLKNQWNDGELGGKAGDYVLVFRVPEGVQVNQELVNSLIKDGIPSDKYHVSIINADILHKSYSYTPKGSDLIGDEGLSYDMPTQIYKAADLKQKALIPKSPNTKIRSLEAIQSGKFQTADPDELVLIDVEGYPYPKWASQFVDQFKPDPSDPRSEELFKKVHETYAEYIDK